MKKYFLLAATPLALALLVATPAQALSCLPVDMYLKEVVGKDNVVILTGTSKDKIEGEGYTAEVLTVETVKQGYAEKEVFVYHQKDETWGYLCNNGPKAEGSTGLYITERDTYGKYNVTQRLELDEAAAAGLEADLKEAEITGEVVELSKTDRMNQTISTITDMLAQITVLLKEYAYWKV